MLRSTINCRCPFRVGAIRPRNIWGFGFAAHPRCRLLCSPEKQKAIQKDCMLALSLAAQSLRAHSSRPLFRLSLSVGVVLIGPPRALCWKTMLCSALLQLCHPLCVRTLFAVKSKYRLPLLANLRLYLHVYAPRAPLFLSLLCGLTQKV